MDPAILRGAYISTAARVVILRDPCSSQRIETLRELNTAAAIDALPVVDADAVFMYRTVLDMTNGQEELPIIELIHLPNMRFLSLSSDSQHPTDNTFYTWPLFAAGKVVSTSMLNSLFCHVFFQSGILKMFMSLAHRQRSSSNMRFVANDSGFACLMLPPGFARHPYLTLFEYCLFQHEVILLGLYRLASGGNTSHRFVFTNPPEDTVLHLDDMVFVLAPPGFDFKEGDSPSDQLGDAAVDAVPDNQLSALLCRNFAAVKAQSSSFRPNVHSTKALLEPPGPPGFLNHANREDGCNTFVDEPNTTDKSNTTTPRKNVSGADEADEIQFDALNE